MFEHKPPHIAYKGSAVAGASYNPAAYNPVGAYRINVSIPWDASQHAIYLHLGAVTSAIYVWVNGAEVICACSPCVAWCTVGTCRARPSLAK